MGNVQAPGASAETLDWRFTAVCVTAAFATRAVVYMGPWVVR